MLGTLLLGPLAGHRRYAHITALRGDAVAAAALGMAKVISEDALRRAQERIDEAASAAWMRPSLQHSVREALDRPWVLRAFRVALFGAFEGELALPLTVVGATALAALAAGIVLGRWRPVPPEQWRPPLDIE
jgi:hypothetical protein